MARSWASAVAAMIASIAPRAPLPVAGRGQQVGEPLGHRLVVRQCDEAPRAGEGGLAQLAQWPARGPADASAELGQGRNGDARVSGRRGAEGAPLFGGDEDAGVGQVAVQRPMSSVVRSTSKSSAADVDVERLGEAADVVEVGEQLRARPALASPLPGHDVGYGPAVDGEDDRLAALDGGDDPRRVVAQLSHRHIHWPWHSVARALMAVRRSRTPPRPAAGGRGRRPQPVDGRPRRASEDRSRRAVGADAPRPRHCSACAWTHRARPRVACLAPTVPTLTRCCRSSAEPLGQDGHQREDRAGADPRPGPREQRRTQPGPPPGEVAPRQGAGVDAGGPLQSSSAEDRNAVPAARQSTAAMFPHPPDVSRVPAARWVRCAPDATTRHPP